jgi:hypothetical protein
LDPLEIQVRPVQPDIQVHKGFKDLWVQPEDLPDHKDQRVQLEVHKALLDHKAYKVLVVDHKALLALLVYNIKEE